MSQYNLGTLPSRDYAALHAGEDEEFHNSFKYQFPWLAVQELHAAVLFEIECGRAHWGDLFAHLESHLLRSPTKSSISSSRPSGAVLFCRDFQTGKCSHAKDHYGTIRNERKWLQLKSTNFFCGLGFQTTLPYIICNALLMQSTLQGHYLFSFLHTAHISCLVKE